MVRDNLWQDEMFHNLQDEIQDNLENKEQSQHEDELQKFLALPIDHRDVFGDSPKS